MRSREEAIEALAVACTRPSYRNRLAVDGARVVIEGTVDGYWSAHLEESDVAPADWLQVEGESLADVAEDLHDAFAKRVGEEVEVTG